jgi:hypothetical protein
VKVRGAYVEIGAILFGAVSGHMLLTSFTSDQTTAFEYQVGEDVEEISSHDGTQIRFTQIVPSDQRVIVERVDQPGSYAVGVGSYLGFGGDFDAIVKAPGHIGQIEVEFQVFRGGEWVATASIESFRPRIRIGEHGVRVTGF